MIFIELTINIGNNVNLWKFFTRLGMLAQPPTQSVHDVLGTSPVSHLNVLTSGTYRGLSGDQSKNWWFNKKWSFRSNSLCITYLFLFLHEEQNDIQKFDTGTSTGRLWDQVAGRSGDQIMGCSRHVRGTLVKYVFFKSTHKHIKLTLAGFSRLYNEW